MCKFCFKREHIAKVCRSKTKQMAAEQSHPANPRQTQRTNNVTEDPEPEDSTYNLFTVTEIHKKKSGPIMVTLQQTTLHYTWSSAATYFYHQCGHILSNTVRCTSTTAYSKNLVYLHRGAVEGPRDVTCHSNIPKPSCKSRADSGRWIRTKLIWKRLVTGDHLGLTQH